MKLFGSLLVGSLLLLVQPLYAATVYWASPSGSDSAVCTDIDSEGTADSPGTDPGSYGTISRAAECMTVAGSILNIKAGTYSGSNHSINVPALASTALTSGTSETNRTYVQGDPSGARPQLNIPLWFVSNHQTASRNRDWLTIRNLNINATGEGGGTATITLGGHHVTIENVLIENSWNVAIGAFCSDPTFPSELCDFIIIRNVKIDFNWPSGTDGNTACVYLADADDALLEHIECVDSTNIFQLVATGAEQTDRATVRYNYGHDFHTATQAGFEGRCQGMQSEGIDSKFYNNVIDLSTCSPGSFGRGISLDFGTNPRADVYNNIIYKAPQYGIAVGEFTTTTGNNIKNNLIVGSGSNAIFVYTGDSATQEYNACGASESCGTTGKVTVAAITDCTVSTSNFTQKVGSSCLNAGVAVTGYPYNGSAPDIGAFETFPFTSASIDTHFMDIILGMNLNIPLLPSSAITGFTVGCTGTNCGTPVIASAARKVGADSVVRLDISGIGGGGNCAVAQTWTVSYSPGNVTDSVYVGNLTTGIVQPLFAFTNQAVTEVCSGSGGSPPAGPSIHYLLDENTGTNAADSEPVTGGDQPGTLTGGPTWTTGHTGSAVAFQNDTTDRYIAVPYGSAVNPSTQSLTICGASKPDVGLESGQKVVFSTTNGSAQRFYVGFRGGFWGIGIQGSGFGTTGQFPVSAAWTHWCLRADSATDTAKLSINGVHGTGSNEVKTYTSYTLAANMRLGNDGTNNINNGGHATDYFKVWTSLLTDQQVLDEFNAWEPPSPAPTGTFEQKGHRWHKLRQTSGGAIENYGDLNATVQVMTGGAVILTTQTDCTVADCSQIAERLRYSKNSGVFLEVPDVMGSDGIAFYGNAAVTDPDILKGTVTCCLTGALTANDGATQYTAAAVPVFDLTQNASVVQRRVLRFDAGLTVGDSFCFKEYNQDGNAFTTYTPSAGACITIVGVAAGLGF